MNEILVQNTNDPIFSEFSESQEAQIQSPKKQSQSEQIFNKIFEWLDDHNLELADPKEKEQNYIQDQKNKVMQLKLDSQVKKDPLHYQKQTSLSNCALSSSTGIPSESDLKSVGQIQDFSEYDSQNSPQVSEDKLGRKISQVQSENKKDKSSFLQMGNSNLMQRRQLKFRSLRMVSPNIESRKEENNNNKVQNLQINNKLVNGSKQRMSVLVLSQNKPDIDEDSIEHLEDSPCEIENRGRKISKQVSPKQMEKLIKQNERLRKISNGHNIRMRLRDCNAPQIPVEKPNQKKKQQNSIHLGLKINQYRDLIQQSSKSAQESSQNNGNGNANIFKFQENMEE